MELSSEGPDPLEALGEWSGSCCRYIRENNECGQPDTGVQDSACGTEDSGGLSQASLGEIQDSEDTPFRRAMLFSLRSDWWIPNCVLTWTDRYWKDPMGFSSVRVSIAGVIVRGLEDVQCRPARWPSLRRYMSSVIACHDDDSYVRLGLTSDPECEAWECDYTGSYPEDYHVESVVGGLNGGLQHRTLGGDTSSLLCSVRRQADVDRQNGISTQRVLEDYAIYPLW